MGRFVRLIGDANNAPRPVEGVRKWRPSSFAGELKYSYKKTESMRCAVERIAKHASLREFLKRGSSEFVPTRLKRIAAHLSDEVTLRQETLWRYFESENPRIRALAKRLWKYQTG